MSVFILAARNRLTNGSQERYEHGKAVKTFSMVVVRRETKDWPMVRLRPQTVSASKPRRKQRKKPPNEGSYVVDNVSWADRQDHHDAEPSNPLVSERAKKLRMMRANLCFWLFCCPW